MCLQAQAGLFGNLGIGAAASSVAPLLELGDVGPETKALPPAPDNTITRIVSSASKSSMICANACHISSDRHCGGPDC